MGRSGAVCGPTVHCETHDINPPPQLERFFPPTGPPEGHREHQYFQVRLRRGRSFRVAVALPTRCVMVP